MNVVYIVIFIFFICGLICSSIEKIKKTQLKSNKKSDEIESADEKIDLKREIKEIKNNIQKTKNIYNGKPESVFKRKTSPASKEQAKESDINIKAPPIPKKGQVVLNGVLMNLDDLK